MRRGLLCALLASALVVVSAASARAETPSDDTYLKNRLNKILEFERSGTRIPWRNPRTGNSGSILIQRTYFLSADTPCRDYLRSIDTDDGESETFRGTGCREATGGWKLTEDPKPRRTVMQGFRTTNTKTDTSGAGGYLPKEPAGIDPAALEGYPVELQLDGDALRNFGPAARREDGTRLERLGLAKEAGDEAAPALPSGPPLAAGIAVPPLAPSTRSPLACAAVAPEGPAAEVSELDLVIVLDTTSSMKGEFEAIQSDVLSSVRLLRRMAARLNVGFVAYRDREDEYTTRAFQLAPMTADNLQRLSLFVKGLRAKGGGDVPEALDEALEVAEAMAWRPTALGQIVVIGDASPRRGAQSRILAAARRFSDGAGEIRRSISTVFTGTRIRQNALKFYQRLAENGGGCFTAEQGTVIESVLLSVLGKRPS